MSTTFKIIPYLTRYQIHSDGTVYSIRYEKFLKQFCSTGGYPRIRLRLDCGKYKTLKVHRLVAEAFLENQYDLRDVDHINCNVKDNRVENLQWLSHKANCNKLLRHYNLNQWSTEEQKAKFYELKEEQKLMKKQK
tara:strand:+ start:120 stop:524 length:405 start_codon:yes stop_codon:yes gene_type:complete